MASVREARNSERRFCFEVVTPQYKRVYQATSEEDMNNWISAINNAVKSTIESGGSIKNFVVTPGHDEAEVAQLKNIPSALTGKTPHYHHSVHGSNPLSNANGGNNIYRRTTVGARPTGNTIRRNSSNFGEDPEKLLQMIRDADPSNSSCADCGSQVKTEWVSINLGIILCIGMTELPLRCERICADKKCACAECSGLHRSLGTHISKVRSLTLDVTSFTPDLVELLCQIGNRIANSVWEAKADPSQRPNAQSSREARLKFITAKYVQRAFVAPLSPTLSTTDSPDELLLDAVKKNDLPAAIYALALHARPDTIDPDTNTAAVMLAIAAADTQAEASTESESLSPTTSGTPPTTFPLAELILQNGAEVPFSASTAQLSQSAKTYVAHKTQKRLNQEASPAVPPLPNRESGSLKEHRLREKDRTQKRVSSGARLHRSPALERQ
jgi:Arf-GAP/SH3 domain/ANK repeat/PH domain-containing protein